MGGQVDRLHFLFLRILCVSALPVLGLGPLHLITRKTDDLCVVRDDIFDEGGRLPRVKTNEQ